MRPIAIAFLLLGIAVSTGAAPVRGATVAGQTELRTAPDPAKRREALGRLIANQRELPFRCPEIPEPVMALQLQPFYRADDPSQSTIDRERLEAYRVESLRAFTEGTNALADYYVGTKPRDGRIASCWADWVERWADKGALLANPATAQGNAERKWMLASIALNYALVADASEIEPARREKIESWIGRLARAWLEAPDYGFDNPNNHVNWGALALMAAGAAINDRAFFDKGVELARLGLAQIDADGSAPLELRRGDRGITYQIFALEPLVVAAEIGLANGIDLYEERGGALHRLASFTRDAMLNPQIVEQLTGVAQAWDGKGRYQPAPPQWGWAQAYYARFHDPTLRDVLWSLRGHDFTQLWLGDMALRFGERVSLP
jgi:poly(beta-D-mannuronate) lyase